MCYRFGTPNGSGLPARPVTNSQAHPRKLLLLSRGPAHGCTKLRQERTLLDHVPMAVVWGSPYRARWSLQSPDGTMTTGRLLRISLLALILALIIGFQLLLKG